MKNWKKALKKIWRIFKQAKCYLMREGYKRRVYKDDSYYPK